MNGVKMFYRVTLTTKEPLDNRLKKDANAHDRRVVWQGYHDNDGWACHEATQMMIQQGYSIDTIEQVEVADHKDGAYALVSGYPKKR
jgi:hypothetical protein